MPATGYTPILLYSSATSGNTPLAADLTTGSGGSELAINITDGKLFYKDSGGVVQVLATKSAAGGSYSSLYSSGTISASGSISTSGSISALGALSVGGTTSLAALVATGSATLSGGVVASGSMNLTSATTAVSASVSGTAQPVPRSQADTLYQTAAGPAFSAYASSGTALTANTAAKVALQAKEFDTANAFDNVTNYRFQPLVAGYYKVEGTLTFGISATYSTLAFVCFIYKNGSAIKSGTFIDGPTLSQSTSVATVLVYLNGSTDYVEMWGYSSSALTTSPGPAYSTLSGFLSRPA